MSPTPTLRTRPRRTAVVTALALACSSLVVVAVPSTPAAASATTFEYREFSQGANIIVSPNCPFGSWAPTTDTLCDTYTVWYIRLAQVIDGGPLDHSGAAFHAELDHEVDLVHPDGTGYAVSFEYGTSPVTGSYDATHLSFAHMDPVTLSMKDVDLDTDAETPNGHTATLGAFDWTAASGVYEWGNDGPAFASGPRHLSTQCMTRNRLAHQKDSVGYVTGTIDGTPVTGEYPDIQIPGLQPADAPGYVFNNWFHVDRVTRCLS